MWINLLIMWLERRGAISTPTRRPPPPRCWRSPRSFHHNKEETVLCKTHFMRTQDGFNVLIWILKPWEEIVQRLCFISRFFLLFFFVRKRISCGLIIQLISIMKEDLIKREWRTPWEIIWDLICFKYAMKNLIVPFCVSYLFLMNANVLSRPIFNIFLSFFCTPVMTAQHYCPLLDVTEACRLPEKWRETVAHIYRHARLIIPYIYNKCLCVCIHL